MARMYVCSNAECNAVLAPFDPPPPPKPAEVIQLSPAELAEATGNAAMLLGQPPAAVPPEPPALAAMAEESKLFAGVDSFKGSLELEPPTADEIENDARRRLEFVRAEIAKLRGYEDEEQRLELMLSALAPASQERAAG